jgi:hypothetical protein
LTLGRHIIKGQAPHLWRVLYEYSWSITILVPRYSGSLAHTHTPSPPLRARIFIPTYHGRAERLTGGQEHGLLLTRWSPHKMVISQDSHLTRWSPHKMVISQGGHLTRWSPHKVVTSQGGHLTRWSSHKVVTSQDGHLTRWSPHKPRCHVLRKIG